MLQLGDGSALAVKARHDRVVTGELGEQRLDRDLAHALAHALLRFVDDTHAAFADHALDAIAPTHHLTDEPSGIRFGIRHRRPAALAKARLAGVFRVADRAVHRARASFEDSRAVPACMDARRERFTTVGNAFQFVSYP